MTPNKPKFCGNFRYNFAGIYEKQNCWCRNSNDTWSPVGPPETCRTCKGEYNYQRECGTTSTASVYDISRSVVDGKSGEGRGEYNYQW